MHKRELYKVFYYCLKEFFAYMYFSVNKVLRTPSIFLRENLSHQEFREIIQHECKKKRELEEIYL